ncbi:T9SS type A sorting domain-containing protein [Ekhidna sp.]|uniref:T9SS type A sorting domain-containing protein n=1 Tax=Ekhidna sp. TaxID=2608089 RepID=UPI0035153404
MRSLITLISFSICAIAFAQTTTQDGSWQNNSNWNATYPGSGTDGDGTLNLNGETLNFNDYITLGSNVSRVNINVANSNFAGEFIVNDTLVIFGDVVFENKSMELTVTSNGVLIVFGDLTMNNKISVDSDGVIVVTGTFTMSGSGAQNDYSGTGNVYAGGYGGNAQSEIDDSGDGDGDSSFTIDELSDDGYGSLEEFVNGGGATPLPVDLLYFNVSNKDHISLSWATASEINNDYFQVERSEDGQHFYEIGRVSGNGNTNEQIEYTFEDKFPLASVEYYRLKQVDFDGQHEYFSVKRISTGIETAQTKISAYPTVVKDGVIKLSSNTPFQIKKVTVYSLSGGEAKSLLENVIQENPLNYQVNASQMSKGIYLLKVVSSEGAELSTRIIVD